MFHVSLSLFPMFPSRALCLPFHFLGLCSFPSTLSYCTSLRLLRSRTCLPLRRIRSLVYIFVHLYSITSELILLTSPSSLSEVLRNARILRLGSGRLASPLFLNSFLRHAFCGGQSIAVRRTRLSSSPRYVWIRSDPNVTLLIFLMHAILLLLLLIVALY